MIFVFMYNNPKNQIEDHLKELSIGVLKYIHEKTILGTKTIVNLGIFIHNNFKQT